jgi:hypothetical protein
LIREARLTAISTAIHVRFGAVAHLVHAAGFQTAALVAEQAIFAICDVRTVFGYAAGSAAAAAIEVRLSEISVQLSVTTVGHDDAAVSTGRDERRRLEVEFGHAARSHREPQEGRA